MPPEKPDVIVTINLTFSMNLILLSLIVGDDLKGKEGLLYKDFLVHTAPKSVVYKSQ